MPEDQIPAKNTIGTLAKEATPPGVVAPEPVESLARPTHSEVPITQPLRDVGVAQIPVPKLSHEEGMEPSPPNFDEIGNWDLPIPIERAKQLAGEDPTEGETDIARIEIHETGKLEQKRRNLAKAA